MNIKIKKSLLGAFLFIVTIGAFVYSFIKYNSALQFPIYTKLSSMKVLTIVNAPVTNKYVKEKYIVNNCSISEAYLYIEASINDEPINANNGEDICFGINQKCEHIIMNNNKVPMPKYLTTSYLYDLSDISLLDYNFNTMKVDNYYPNANLIDKMNKQTIEIVAAISSNRNKKQIEKMKIYYICENNCSTKDVSCGIMSDVK